jgi:hypothetical protein
MTPLPKIGLQAVLEGMPGFTKALDTVNKGADESTKKMKEAAKAADPFSSGLNKLGLSLDSVKDKIAKFTGLNREAIDGIFELTQSFGPMAVAIGASVIAVAALAVGFVKLGERGAALVPLAQSFDNLTASVGISSQALLVDLRKAANGTVSDFDLIKRANLALVGTSGEFGKAFGEKLPAVLRSARAAAKATGQDVDFLFQSLVSGIKRASPRLIDNTGIVLKLSAANEALAKSLHKSVEQLTDEEKQIAVLNATVDAGDDLIQSLGNAAESNAEKLARSQATITNIFDTLAVAVQPAFATVLDIVNRVLGAFQQLAVGIAPILSSIASIITDILGGAINAILDIISPIASALASFLPYISILFQGIANVVHGAVTFIGNIIKGVVTFIQDVAKNLFGLDISNLGKSLFEGAAAAFGSFANGILSVANQLIFPAVIGIAKFIADFLIGFSPPKMGPLSMIDKGGENLMKAWLDGIAGVSLDPVEQVAAEVSAMLGDIGKATAPQVDARLKQLDQALLPFQNRLDIVKSQFDAIAAPAQAALDAIDRQMLAAQEALQNGDVNAANTIRKLDAAREAIQGQLDAQQAVVDQQQIQLGLATAAQSQERALLNIRKAQLAATQKVGAAVAKAGGVAKDPKAAGGAAPNPMETGGAAGGFVPPGESVLDLIGGQSAVNDAIAGIQDAFAGQIDTSQLDLFGQNSGALQEQFDRIGSVDLGAKLSDKFKGLTDLFNPEVEGSPANSIKTFVSTLTAGADTPGSIASFFSNVGPNVQAATAGLGDAISAQFDPNVDGTPANVIVNAVKTLTGDEATADSLASFFAQLPQNVSTAAGGLFDMLQTNVFKPVTDFLTGTGPGTLSGVIDGVVAFFTELPTRVAVALAGMGAAIYGALVVPVISTVNSLIGAVEGAIRTFVQGIATFIQGIADGIDSVGLGIDTAGIHNIANDLNAKAAGIALGRIPVTIPDFAAAIPTAATGGLFGPGAINVGEHGPERIFAADKIGILPAELTKALEGLGSILAQPAPMMVPGGDTYNNSSSSSFTFNGVKSDQDARRRYNALRAGMR